MFLKWRVPPIGDAIFSKQSVIGLALYYYIEKTKKEALVLELNEYLTQEEQEQLDSIMKKVRERKEEAETRQFMLLECQCRCLKQMELGEQKKSCVHEEIQDLLSLICEFCRQHGYCVCNKKKEWKGDEEMPFD